MARAISSLPVPLSPLIKTVESVWAMVSISFEYLDHLGIGADDVLEFSLSDSCSFELDVFPIDVLLVQRLA